MPSFRKKPVVVEAITFDELVQHGIEQGAPLHNGMPWSFEYKGQPITHENDDCYLIPTLEGTMRFERGEWLITGVNGEIYPCKADIFEKTYEPAASCGDCGLPYPFGLDTVLSKKQWELITSNTGALLCANCIVKRAGALKVANAPRFVRARMVLE